MDFTWHRNCSHVTFPKCQRCQKIWEQIWNKSGNTSGNTSGNKPGNIPGNNTSSVPRSFVMTPVNMTKKMSAKCFS